MLRGNFKTKLIYGGTLLTAFSLTLGSAWAGEIGTDTAAGTNKIQNAQLTCNPQATEYTKIIPPNPNRVTDPAALQGCQKCQQAVKAQVDKVDQARNGAIQQNNA